MERCRGLFLFSAPREPQGAYDGLSVYPAAVGFEAHSIKEMNFVRTPKCPYTARFPSGRRPSRNMFSANAVCDAGTHCPALKLTHSGFRPFTVQLRRMSDGRFHPDASIPIINGPDYGREGSVDFLACWGRVRMSSGPPSTRLGLDSHLVVWDWRTRVKYVAGCIRLRRPDANNPPFFV